MTAHAAKENSFFASCPRGLEGMLKTEIETIIPKDSLESLYEERGGQRFHTNIKDALRFVVHGRSTSRLYRELFSFGFKHEKEFSAKVQEIDWPALMELDDTFKINTIFDGNAKRNFKSSIIFSQLMKDAIADTFRDKFGQRPSVDKENPLLNFLIRIEVSPKKGWYARLLLDLTGVALSDRGYRVESKGAPLRENLAAALVHLSDWDKKSDFLDPFCGTGTLLIEAAMIALDLPPQQIAIRDFVERQSFPFSFLAQKWFATNKELQIWWSEFAKSTHADIIKKLNQKFEHPLIFGSDKNARILDLARVHIKEAGLPHSLFDITFESALERRPPSESGLILCNPPYGERLMEPQEAFDLVHDFGEHLKQNFKGWRAGVILPHGELKKAISLRTSAKIPVWNGQIECRLFMYELF